MLTDNEHELLDLTGEIFILFSRITGDGPSRDDDLAEVALHLHAIQNMILAQAAGRLYPNRYRLLGETVRSLFFSKTISARNDGSEV